MVIKTPTKGIRTSKILGRRGDASSSIKQQLVVANERYSAELDAAVAQEDVIDLGAPQILRRNSLGRLFASGAPRLRRTYIPNPRLYPGPAPKLNRANKKPKLPAEANRKEVQSRDHRRKRTFRRPVPNSRLYRPASSRPPPPPARPRTFWPPLESLCLDTASRVALRVAEQRRPVPLSVKAPGHISPVKRLPAQSPSRRLVVTLPAAASGDAPTPYQPVSEHFRQRSSAMDAPTASRHSASPEVSSEGNETLSAPSEFLAEFLSAIMQRQYSEALKYCRLILQYEPHNATARGFYPLLRHKLQINRPSGAEAARDNSSSDSTKSPRGRVAAPVTPTLDSREDMEQEADESGSGGRSRSRSSGSCGSQSSLEMDSSEVLVNSSPSPSHSLSRKTDHTDSETGASVGSLGSTGSAVSRGSQGECTRCRSRAPDTDDNGNEPDAENAHAQCDDLENDNTHTARSRDLKRESSSLRRLRAQFACSIK